jgi:hypothetical protein
MDAIQFTTVVGSDGLIHPPEGVLLPEGEIEVSVRARNGEAPTEEPHPHQWLLDIARESEELDIELPTDVAENHDHYAHGAPKRV